jgi:hypothetical protein
MESAERSGGLGQSLRRQSMIRDGVVRIWSWVFVERERGSPLCSHRILLKLYLLWSGSMLWVETSMLLYCSLTGAQREGAELRR